MKPYYEAENIRIYHGDCRDVDAEASVMVTDPPYGMAYKSGWVDKKAIAGDESLELRDHVLQKWSGPALVFGTPSQEKPQGTRITLVWDKGDWPGMGDLKLPWGPSHEEIYVLGEGWVGKRQGTVIHCPQRKNGNHPTAKPVELMERLLDFCPPGIILDPFMGGGATLVAARNLGWPAIGIEVEEEYCELAARELSQGNLFA